MNKLTIKYTIESREVAEMVGKRHENLLADIKGYAEMLSKKDALKVQGIYEVSDFFIESTHRDAYNE